MRDSLDLIALIDERIDARLRQSGAAPATPRQMRLAKNLDVKSLSELAEVGRSTIYRLESGEIDTAPEPKTVERLAKVLGVKPGEYAVAVDRMRMIRK